MELAKKHRRNLLLNGISYAVAALREALQIADEDGLEIAIDIEDEIDELIKISNTVEAE